MHREYHEFYAVYVYLRSIRISLVNRHPKGPAQAILVSPTAFFPWHTLHWCLWLYFRSNSLIGNKSARAIAPAPASAATAVDMIEQAQLLLRLPGGHTMQLSNLPFVKSPTKNASPTKRQGLEEVVKKSSKKVCISMNDCVELPR